MFRVTGMCTGTQLHSHVQARSYKFSVTMLFFKVMQRHKLEERWHREWALESVWV